jgi:hypothetical protein
MIFRARLALPPSPVAVTVTGTVPSVASTGTITSRRSSGEASGPAVTLATTKPAPLKVAVQPVGREPVSSANSWELGALRLSVKLAVSPGSTVSDG